MKSLKDRNLQQPFWRGLVSNTPPGDVERHRAAAKEFGYDIRVGTAYRKDGAALPQLVGIYVDDPAADLDAIGERAMAMFNALPLEERKAIFLQRQQQDLD